VFTPCIVLEDGTNDGKNHDKLITFTVRVRSSSFYFFLKVRVAAAPGLRKYTHPLANGAHRPALYFLYLYKTVNCHMQVPQAQTGLF